LRRAAAIFQAERRRPFSTPKGPAVKTMTLNSPMKQKFNLTEIA
jgi:hypothetical protein